MHTVAVIQARTGSSRLPGKVLYPLAGEHVLAHDVRRLRAAERVDDVVVATSTERPDDAVARAAERAGATVFRGSETDVLGRMHGAASEHDADVVVRATGDDPLVSPAAVDAVARAVADGAEYASTDETVPPGLVAEAAAADSLASVAAEATALKYREHVTLYFRDHEEGFEVRTLPWAETFGFPRPADAASLRFTLDQPADYELLRRLYEALPVDPIVDEAAAVEYAVDNGLTDLNSGVEQRSP